MNTADDQAAAGIEAWLKTMRERLDTCCESSPITPAVLSDMEFLLKQRTKWVEVGHWAQAVLTALNVGDVQSGSMLHVKLREVMIASRQD